MAAESFQFRGALIREQGVTFAVVEVAPEILAAGEKRINEERSRYEPVFPKVPVILAAKGSDKRARYYGRPDIVRFLSAAGWGRIPWKRYTARRKDRNPFREWA